MTALRIVVRSFSQINTIGDSNGAESLRGCLDFPFKELEGGRAWR